MAGRVGVITGVWRTSQSPRPFAERRERTGHPEDHATGHGSLWHGWMVFLTVEVPTFSQRPERMGHPVNRLRPWALIALDVADESKSPPFRGTTRKNGAPGRPRNWTWQLMAWMDGFSYRRRPHPFVTARKDGPPGQRASALGV